MQHTITLDPLIEAFLQSKLGAGRSVDEIVREALQTLAERDGFDDRMLESLAQARAGETFDADEVFAEVRRDIDRIEHDRTA